MAIETEVVPHPVKANATTAENTDTGLVTAETVTGATDAIGVADPDICDVIVPAPCPEACPDVHMIDAPTTDGLTVEAGAHAPQKRDAPVPDPGALPPRRRDRELLKSDGP